MTEAELDSELEKLHTKEEKLWYLGKLKFNLDMQDYWYQDDHDFWELLVTKINQLRS